MTDKEDLKELVKRILGERLLVVVSNREPYIHTFSRGKVECIVPASGLTTALDPVLRASQGIWIAHGSGDADREVIDSSDKVMVPPEQPSI